MKKRFVAAAIGLIYAILYGVFTLMITGGGHGNFIWFTLFLGTYFVGIFFPVAGFLVVDLHAKWARISIVVLLSLHLIALSFWVTKSFGPEEWPYLLKDWNRSQLSFIFFAVLHFLPVIFVITFVIIKLRLAGSLERIKNSLP